VVFPVIRSAFAYMKTSHLPTSHSREWQKIANLAQRWSSSQLVGSAPSQLPLPGEPGWTEFVENVEQSKLHPPLTPAEVQQGQKIYRIQKQIAELQAKVEELYVLNSQLKENLSGEDNSQRAIFEPMLPSGCVDRTRKSTFKIV